jgi:hypothetical protein
MEGDVSTWDASTGPIYHEPLTSAVNARLATVS